MGSPARHAAGTPPEFLLIMESPAKAAEIVHFLDSRFDGAGCFGHVVELPAGDGYGIDTSTWEEQWIPRRTRGKPWQVEALAARIRQHRYRAVLLATDADREGEAIAFHLATFIARELNLSPSFADRLFRRVVFREITPAGARRGLQDARPIDLHLVDAQRARRALDRVYGWDGSRALARPIGAPSVGRVQTFALYLIVLRERAVSAFAPHPYHTLHVQFSMGAGDELLTGFVPSRPDHVSSPPLDPADSGDRLSAAAEEDPREQGRGALPKLHPHPFPTREAAERVRDLARPHPHQVQDIHRARLTRSAGAGYKAATLVQDAGNKLGLTTERTAELAQLLYLEGFITYWRTDSTRTTEQGIAIARAAIAGRFPDALPETPRVVAGDATAQDAHEAIRPTAVPPEKQVPAEARELYDMIEARYLASQCKDAVLERTLVRVRSGSVVWIAEGLVVAEPNFLHFWDQRYARREDATLPPLAAGQVLTVAGYEIADRRTRPPARYTSATLVAALEAARVGRPSTFQRIEAVLVDRGTVHRLQRPRKNALPPLAPTPRGDLLVAGLESYAPTLLERDYTARMEADLDQIAAGRTARSAYLSAWYRDFTALIAQAAPSVAAFQAARGIPGDGPPRGPVATATTCSACRAGTYVQLGRRDGSGAFLKCAACGHVRDVDAIIHRGACPREGCGGDLIEHTGRRGRWTACPRPGCGHKQDLAQPAPPGGATGRGTVTAAGAGKGSSPWKRTPLATVCPKCTRASLVELVRSEGRNTVVLHACSDRKNCDHVSRAPPAPR